MITRFEIGKTYTCPSACDSNCIFKVKIVKRTEKTVTVEGFRNKRCSIKLDNHGEYIIPEHYSMAPVFHSEEAA